MYPKKDCNNIPQRSMEIFLSISYPRNDTCTLSHIRSSQARGHLAPFNIRGDCSGSQQKMQPVQKAEWLGKITTLLPKLIWQHRNSLKMSDNRLLCFLNWLSRK